ncbi:MAG: transporter [Opitutaceae bacterium]
MLRPSQLVSVAALCWVALPRPAAAQETDPGSESAADKSLYTLWNPTPDDLLRDMDTDRPNITNTPHTIDAGHWQLETGLLDYVHDRAGTAGSYVQSESWAVGQFNLRVGIFNQLELNVAVTAQDTDRVTDDSPDATVRAGGLGDTVVGGKINVWGDDARDAPGTTALAIQPQFKFPTARSGVGDGWFEFDVVAPFLCDLPAGAHLGLQPGVSHARNAENTAYTTGFPAAISLDRTVIGELDVYLEYAAEPTTERHERVPQTLDVGGTLPLGRNAVIDAGANLGLDRTAPNVEILTGISLRR